MIYEKLDTRTARAIKKRKLLLAHANKRPPLSYQNRRRFSFLWSVVAAPMLSPQNTRCFSVARKKHVEQTATSPVSFSTINTPIKYLRPVSKERNVRTNVVGIFMSTSTGNTDQAAECIRKYLASHTTNMRISSIQHRPRVLKLTQARLPRYHRTSQPALCSMLEMSRSRT